MNRMKVDPYDPNFNVIESQYYRLSKYFLIVFGQWPMMKKFTKVLMSSIILSYLMIMIYPGVRDK